MRNMNGENMLNCLCTLVVLKTRNPYVITELKFSNNSFITNPKLRNIY